MFGSHIFATALRMATENRQARREPDEARREPEARDPAIRLRRRPGVDDMFETIPSLIRKIPAYREKPAETAGAAPQTRVATDPGRAAALSVLGLSGNPATDEIRHAFNAAVKRCHPDLAGTAPETAARYRDVVAAHGYLTKAR